MKKIISLRNIGYSVSESVRLDKIKKVILNGISLDLAESSITALIGESGCGKTTLAKILSGIIKPTEGTIDIAENSNIQILFQNSEELIHPFRKVRSILEDVTKDKNEILSICDLLGISEKVLNQKGISLSGGERQRAGLARILLNKPNLIILDEPFSAQDPDSIEQLITLFKDINTRCKSSLLIISHNISHVKMLTENIFIMLKGRIIETGTTKEVIASPMHPYTRFLIRAESYDLKRNEINLTDESVLQPCPFYSNCDRKVDMCNNSIEICHPDNRMVLCNNSL